MSDDYVPTPCINICTIDPDSGIVWVVVEHKKK